MLISNRKIQSINLNDIPYYSPWIKMVLSSQNIDIKNKNKSEIIREFDIEKWGIFLNKFSNMKNFTLNQIIDEEITTLDNIWRYIKKF